MKINLKTGFFRIAVVCSISVYLVFLLGAIIEGRIFSEIHLLGVVYAVGVWLIYFLFRWVVGPILLWLYNGIEKKRETIKVILWIIITACVVAWTIEHCWREKKTKTQRLDIAQEDYLIRR